MWVRKLPSANLMFITPTKLFLRWELGGLSEGRGRYEALWNILQYKTQTELAANTERTIFRGF
jgi:hypothetical protein